MTHSPQALSASLQKLDACIHCGFCLPACPTYAATGSEAESPRGRLYLMRDWLGATPDKPARFSTHQVGAHLDACLGCLACQTACPSGVEYGALLHTARQRLADERPMTWSRRLKRFAMRRLLPAPGAMTALRRAVRLYQASGAQTLLRKTRVLSVTPALANAEALLPPVPRHEALRAGATFGPATGERVILPTGCVMDAFYNPAHWATIRVLSACGFCVTIPPAGCCGALADHSGEDDIADERALATMREILTLNPRWIALNSAGCGSTMQGYGHRFADNAAWAARAAHFSALTIDIMALLNDHARPALTAAMTQVVPRRVAYHAACHLHHGQGVQRQPLDLLALVPGLTLIPLTDAAACCGSAGVYNLENPQLAEDILAEKIARIVDSGADAIAAGNPGCLLQIAKGLRDAGRGDIQTLHPVEILAEALAPSP
ncbi:MAG: 4Fe-4S dicluster domain-containing protein [Vampirovibrionales bacterium]|nr:4Fe-4S dicluster domain-containing protein [Vampirovibrionales bacterium]